MSTHSDKVNEEQRQEKEGGYNLPPLITIVVETSLSVFRPAYNLVVHLSCIIIWVTFVTCVFVLRRSHLVDLITAGIGSNLF